jgi:inner membrane transporter RhtA
VAVSDRAPAEAVDGPATGGRGIAWLDPFPPVALVIIASTSVQFGAALGATLFDTLGPGGASLLRQGFAAVVLLAIWRPRLGAHPAAALRLAGAFGLTLGLMNLCFYEALDRIPLGVAVTLEFVGPLAVALIDSRRPLDLVWVVCAAVGVVVLSRPSGSADAAGVALALAAGVFWGGYIHLSARIGRVFPGGRGLALAMAVAAALMLVPGTLAAGGDLIDPGAAAVGAAAGVLSSVIPYSLELEALRRLAVGTFGVLMSLEPAVAALVGLIALDQGLGALDVLGIALVVVASAGVLGAAGAEAPTEA